MSTPISEPMLTLAELREALEARGLEFSDSRLKRLRREGLLQVDGQRHRAGVRGSESLYPSGAVDQLELVARLEAQERRFAQLRVLVRWHGGWVDPDKLRASLIGLLEAISAQARLMTAGTVDQGDRVDRLAEAMTRRPGRSGVSRLMRRRLKDVADGMQRAAYAFAALATRTPVEWENHDPNDPAESLLAVFERASGMDRAQADDISGEGPLMRERPSSQEVLAELQQAGLFDILDLGAAFEAASDEAIERAFDDAIAVAGLSGAFEAIQSVAGDDIGGLGSITELGAAQQAIDLAAVVRGLLLLRPLIPEGALENMVEEAAKAGPQLKAAQGLARALPHLIPYLGPGGTDRFAALPDDERERVSDELRSYLQTRPELVAALASPDSGGEERTSGDGARALRTTADPPIAETRPVRQSSG